MQACPNRLGKAGLLEPANSAETATDFLAFVVAREAYGVLCNVFFAVDAVALWHARNAQVFHNNLWTGGKILNKVAELFMLWKLRAPGENERELLTTWANVMKQG